MRKAEDFMNIFMEKLNSDAFVKDNMPNTGPELTAEFVERQVMFYRGLLKIGLIDKATR